MGSSYLQSERNCAYLYAQIENPDIINNDRLQSWNTYYELLTPLKEKGCIDLPVVPEGCVHNAHMFYIKTKDLEERSRLIAFLKENGIGAVFHTSPSIHLQQVSSLADFMVRINIQQKKANDF